MLGQPSYPVAETAAAELIESIRAGVQPVEVVSAGEVVAIARSQWGQSTELIATETITVSSTQLAGLDLRLEAASRSTVLPGADAGSIVVTAGGVEQVVRLESTTAITEPGVAWRFADPLTVLSRWTG
jgi:serine-type D-Ala-D-Ala carboxypeptidase (penicillin-binding protein 5/6)